MFTDAVPDEINETIRERPLSSHVKQPKRLSQELAATHAKLAKEQLSDETPVTVREQMDKKQKVKEKRRLATMNSLFGQYTDDIQKLIEIGDNDIMSLRFQKNMLVTLIDVLPIAEEQYRKNPGQSNSYAFSGLIAQCRELINDIQAASDRSLLSNRIGRDILIPAFTRIAQNVIDTMHYTKRELESIVPDDKVVRLHTSLDNSAKSIAKFINDMYGDIQTKTNEMIMEE